MTRVNFDPHQNARVFTPTNRLTALFASVEAAREAITALQASGFPDEEIDLFFGEEGANVLDLAEEHHGLTGRLIRAWEYLVTDDHLFHTRSDRALRAGQALLAVKTTAQEEKKASAAVLLKEAGAHDICFWGKWTTEQVG